MVNTNHEILGYLILPHSHLELSVHGSPQWLVRKSWKIHLQMDNLRVMTPCRSEKAGFSRKKTNHQKNSETGRVTRKKNNFTSCDPHHDIYTFSYWQIFWHSIWHIFWHSIWHSIWQIFWHSIWHIFWHSIWQIFWHSIWHIFWHSIWHIFWHSICPLRAVHTELGRSPVEVQRCTLRWANPRLRSSGAHWAGQVPGWGPAVHTELRRSLVEVPVHTELGSWQRAWRRELAKSLAKSWQGGSGGGSWCRHGRGETRRGGGGGQLAEEEEEENSSDKI